MKHKLRRTSHKLNNTKGFSMAEMLMTLAILAILMALAIVGVGHYQKVLKGMEMDNNAKQIFLAAQNHLTSSELSGELGRYRKACSPGGSVTSSEITGLGAAIADTDKPSDFPADLTWTSGEYCYVVYNPLPGGVNTVTLDGSILKYMLPFGATEETLRSGGKYVIEYNPKTATVYSVFYTESKNSLTYTDVAALNTSRGRGSDTDARQVRRGYSGGIIGYYGGAAAMKEAGTLLEEPTIDVNNGETLEVVITDPNYFKKNAEGNAYHTTMKVTITGLFSGNKRELEFELGGTADSPSLPISHAAWWTGVKTVDDGGQDVLQYVLTLDDITKENMHFADLFEKGAAEGAQLIPGEDLNISVKYTNSDALGILIESYNSETTNSLFGDGTSRTAVGGTGGTEHTVTAEIKAFRHIENLDQQISNLYELATVGKVLVTEAVQTENLNWTDYYAKAGEEKKITFCQGISGTAPDTGTFFSVKTSYLTKYEGNNHTITGLVINNTATLAADDTLNGGLFRMVSSAASGGDKSFTIQNLKLENWDVTANGTIGLLAAEVGNTISDFAVNNIEVKDCSVTSNDGTAGGLCGIAANSGDAKIQNVTVTNPIIHAAENAAGVLAEIKGGSSALEMKNILVTSDADKYSSNNIESSKPRGNAGGLLAYAGRTVKIEDCAASIQVKATGQRENSESLKIFAGDAGGLVGELGAGGNTISNCYTGGRTNNGAYALGQKDGEGDAALSEANVYAVDSAGGLIGKINGTTTITDCYSTCSVAVEDKNPQECTSSAGGLVGIQNVSGTDSVRYEKCYATGLVRGQAGSGGTETVNIGALVGSAGTNSTWTDCSYLTDPWKAWNEVQGKAAPSDISDLRAVGNYPATPTPSGISARSYDEMPKSNPTVETHNYDSSLDGKSYPFCTLEQLGASVSRVSNVHYGDWPVKWMDPILDPVIPPLDPSVSDETILFAYKEVKDDKTYWYVVAAGKTANTSSQVVAYGSNVVNLSEGEHVSSTLGDYGYLMNENSPKNSRFKSVIKHYDFSETSSATVQIMQKNGTPESFYFFPYIGTKSNETKRSAEAKGLPGGADFIYYFNPTKPSVISTEESYVTNYGTS
ncbi:MAG: type II secretion system protein [Anaerovoracaceae bacterium]